MTTSTIFVDEVTIPEGSVVSREPEHELADRILHLVEDKLHATVVNAAKERFVIRHPHSGRVLDVSAAGVANGTKVQLWDANKTKAQEWKFDDDGLIINPRSGKCLTAHGYECGGSPSLVIWVAGVDVHGGRHAHSQGDRKGPDRNERQPPRDRGSQRAQGHAAAVAAGAAFFDEMKVVC
jgi:Ricin-type beta-trefoil lectin domain-like